MLTELLVISTKASCSNQIENLSKNLQKESLANLLKLQ